MAYRRLTQLPSAQSVTRQLEWTLFEGERLEEFHRGGVYSQTLDVGIYSRPPAGKLLIGAFSSFSRYERENNRESLAAIELAKHLGWPAERAAGQVAKVAEIVTPTGSSCASAKRCR